MNEANDRRRVRRALTDDEIIDLLEIVPPHRRLIYKFLIFTGLRRSEAKLLRVADIDLKHRCVRLRSETTKNRQAAQLPLHDDLITDLRAYLKDKDEPDALLFAAIPRATTVRRDFEEAGIAIEDERGHRLDLHALRATFATRLLQSGVPVAKAAQLTRHKSVAILEKHYNKLGKRDAEDAMRALKPLPRVGRNGNGKSPTPSQSQSQPAPKIDAPRAAPCAAPSPPKQAEACQSLPNSTSEQADLKLVGGGTRAEYNSAADTGLPPGAEPCLDESMQIAQVLTPRAIGAVGCSPSLLNLLKNIDLRYALSWRAAPRAVEALMRVSQAKKP